jgi:prefoldin subunit 5
MDRLLEGLKELKPFQLRERANLIDTNIVMLQEQIAALRETKKVIREEQATRKGEPEAEDS